MPVSNTPCIDKVLQINTLFSEITSYLSPSQIYDLAHPSRRLLEAAAPALRKHTRGSPDLLTNLIAASIRAKLAHGDPAGAQARWNDASPEEKQIAESNGGQTSQYLFGYRNVRTFHLVGLQQPSEGQDNAQAIPDTSRGLSLAGVRTTIIDLPGDWTCTDDGPDLPVLVPGLEAPHLVIRLPLEHIGLINEHVPGVEDSPDINVYDLVPNYVRHITVVIPNVWDLNWSPTIQFHEGFPSGKRVTVVILPSVDPGVAHICRSRARQKKWAFFPADLVYGTDAGTIVRVVGAEHLGWAKEAEMRRRISAYRDADGLSGKDYPSRTFEYQRFGDWLEREESEGILGWKEEDVMREASRRMAP